jgi:hypothetical protein
MRRLVLVTFLLLAAAGVAAESSVAAPQATRGCKRFLATVTSPNAYTAPGSVNTLTGVVSLGPRNAWAIG